MAIPNFWTYFRSIKTKLIKLGDTEVDEVYVDRIQTAIESLDLDMGAVEGDVGNLEQSVETNTNTLAGMNGGQFELGCNVGSYNLPANDTDGFILEFQLWDDVDAETPVLQDWFNGYIPFSLVADNANVGTGVVSIDETYSGSTGFFEDSEGDFYLKFENGVCKQVVAKASGTLEVDDFFTITMSRDHTTNAEAFINNVPVNTLSVVITVVAGI